MSSFVETRIFQRDMKHLHFVYCLLLIAIILSMSHSFNFDADTRETSWIHAYAMRATYAVRSQQLIHSDILWIFQNFAKIDKLRTKNEKFAIFGSSTKWILP